jgi:hypothetical protein
MKQRQPALVNRSGGGLNDQHIANTIASRLVVTYRAISDLIPDPRNARTRPKRQIE